MTLHDPRSLRTKLSEKNCTFLGVGPMSLNCVNAVIELAYDYPAPLMLIASRRQIDCVEFGGGYVNNWDTFAFARYVRDHDPEGRILLARDHGGPWQHPQEVELCANIKDAMASAKRSYFKDIQAGFDILHIDPVVIYGQETPSLEWVVDKVLELFSFCMETAQVLGKKVYVELGTEEQQQSPLSDLSSIKYLIKRVNSFCQKNKYELPIYIVIQTGTKVMGTDNIGYFPKCSEEVDEYIAKHKLDEAICICNSNGILVKEHNADYLSDHSLAFHRKIGINAANVAPEFGLVETKAIFEVMDELGLIDLKAEFIDIALQSKKWEKWLVPGVQYSNLEKATICGHYVFSHERICEIKESLRICYQSKNMESCLDRHLMLRVKKAIFRYMINFGMI
jgi:hypothetical protein